MQTPRPKLGRVQAIVTRTDHAVRKLLGKAVECRNCSRPDYTSVMMARKSEESIVELYVIEHQEGQHLHGITISNTRME